MRKFVIAFLLLAARVAVADPTPDTMLAPPGMTAPVPAPEELKDPNVATALAVAGSIAPIAIVGLAIHDSRNSDNLGGIAALTVGTFLFLPSAGHFYAGRFFTPGMITRAAGLSVAGLGVLMLVASEGDSGANVFWAGAITTAAGVVVDLATAGREADRYNESHRTHLKPVAMKFHGGGYGAGLAGSF